MLTYIPTCETAVSTVPEWHRDSFKGHEDKLTSPDGWSPGALNLAQGIAMKLHAPLLHANLTRLLIDLSQHPEDGARWSAFSRGLTDDQRDKLDRRSKLAFLESLEARIDNALRREEAVIHLSIDTSNNLDPGTILFEFDSRRDLEANCVSKWKAALSPIVPQFRIDQAPPPSRSLSSYLRDRFPKIGSVKLTVAQSAFLEGKPMQWMKLKKLIVDSIPPS